MRYEDAQTLAVFLFELGWPPSAIDRRMHRPAGFAHDAVLERWELMGMREAWR